MSPTISPGCSAEAHASTDGAPRLRAKLVDFENRGAHCASGTRLRSPTSARQFQAGNPQAQEPSRQREDQQHDHDAEDRAIQFEELRPG